MYQVLQHALAEKDNTTHFTLIFANVSPQDILLKEEFDAWKKKYPKTFDVVYTVDKPEGEWHGNVGFVNKELIQQHIAPASLGEKVKVYICGPPGQVAAIAGKKDGMKQGALGGTLKELGYTEDQVRSSLPTARHGWCTDAMLSRYSSSRGKADGCMLARDVSDGYIGDIYECVYSNATSGSSPDYLINFNTQSRYLPGSREFAMGSPCAF